MIEKQDVLKYVYEGRWTEDDAHDFFDVVIDSDEVWLEKPLCMSRQEWTALGQGTPFEVIAKWRYEGWPDKCIETGEPINYKEFGWFVVEYDEDLYSLIKLVFDPDDHEED